MPAGRNTTPGFAEAIASQDWAQIAAVGMPLIRTGQFPSDPEGYVQLCLGLERAGRWLQLADAAQSGVDCLDQLGIADERIRLLLKSLGRGLYDRQQYAESARAYDRLLELATSAGSSEDIWSARFSIACCLERLGEDQWARALEEYCATADGTTDYVLKLAALSNYCDLLLKAGRLHDAYETATMAAIVCPQQHRRGAAWADLLRVIAHMEVLQGRPDVALTTIMDAIDTTPDNRPGVLSLAHAVRALACLELDDRVEAELAIDLAWDYAELSPNSTTCGFLRQVERAVEGGC